MKRVCRIICLALVATGCAKPSLVGEWRGQQTRNGLTGMAHLSLKDDAKFSMTVSVVSSDNMPGLSRQVTSGTYKANGDTLALTVKRMSLDGVPIEVPPGNTTTKVHYRIKGNTLTLDLGRKDRLTLHRA